MPVIGMVFATVSFVAYCIMIKTLSNELPGIFSGSAAPWAYIGVILCFGAMIAVNLIYKAKNIQVAYKDVSEFLLPYNERPSTLEKQKANAAQA